MHGANDAQKTMGIITGALVTGGYLTTFEVPFWVEFLSYTAIGLGTLSGGWRIIKTMGTKITKLQPVGGFAAETGAAVAIYTATAMGVGISTTHTITGAIIGVGATRAPERRPLGRRRPDRLGLAPHDSRVGDDRRADVSHRARVRCSDDREASTTWATWTTSVRGSSDLGPRSRSRPSAMRP